MKRTIRLAVASAALAGTVGLVTTSAQAAEPNCVGKTLSALAMPSRYGDFGHAVVAFAQQPDGSPGLGNSIAALRAGVVPDVLVPNVCN